MPQKTVIITCFHPAILRNILLTDVVPLLRRANVRVVVLVLGYKKHYFEEQLADTGVVVQGISFDYPSRRFLTLLCKRIARLSLDTATARVEKRMKWKREGKWWYYIVASVLGKIMSRSLIARRIFRQIDTALTATKRYYPYFKKYTPDLVIVTDVQNEREVEVLQNARGFGLRSFAMVRNWDNLTSHGLLRAHPDTLLVPSGEVRRHAMMLNDLSSERVRLIGIPHYDRYVRGPTISREKYFERYGFDPSKKLILLGLVGDWYIPDNDTDPYLVELASKWGANVLVRFHPTVTSKALEAAVPPRARMAFYRPGIAFAEGRAEDREIGREDDEELLHSLAYSDLVVCGPSTIALDAMFFDTPVVLINFHRRPRMLDTGGIIKYDCDHFRFVLSYGAAVLAESPEALRTASDAYLRNPSLHTEGRAAVKNAYCGPLDGNASRRMAHEIFDALELRQAEPSFE